MKLFLRGRREKRKKEDEKSENDGSKDDVDDGGGDDDDNDNDDDGRRRRTRSRWKGECAGSKLPNYFSSCPRGPGKIIIKTSRGAG